MQFSISRPDREHAALFGDAIGIPTVLAASAALAWHWLLRPLLQLLGW
jgi:hypothetical protein